MSASLLVCALFYVNQIEMALDTGYLSINFIASSKCLVLCALTLLSINLTISLQWNKFALYVFYIRFFCETVPYFTDIILSNTIHINLGEYIGPFGALGNATDFTIKTIVYFLICRQNTKVDCLKVAHTVSCMVVNKAPSTTSAGVQMVNSFKVTRAKDTWRPLTPL
uniref:Serpentine receptor class gamma n=1 Tax=Steinernema glaseri TaxID=37863 RepID=A0A1I7ZZ55_9BILA